jgi:plasmid stability protein
MASLTLENLPEDLLRDLREAASEDRRSLSQETVHLLESALRSRVKRAASTSAGSTDVDRQLAAWRELAGKWESEVDRETEIECIMERRTGGREVER